MKNSKRLLAMCLMVAMVFTMLPVQAFATDGQAQTVVDTGDVTVQGTNGFGTLLSKELEEAESDDESEEYKAGYSVTDLVIENGTASVTYSSLEDAIMVVALYSEDGMRMLTSAMAEISPEDTDAVLEFTDEMPEYFLASAYLMDIYDYSPLCASYDTPMYTREMQELLESTVDDYDEDRVLNLDNDKTTNFAVYAEEIVVIESVEGKNIVASTDEENETYVIKNADAQITSLEEGTIFVYSYGENEMLIVKVASIQLNGKTATITGADVEMDEVFSHLKIEAQNDMGEIIVDDSDLTDGLIYEGVKEENYGGIRPLATDGSVSGKNHMDFTFEAFKDEETGTELNGSLEFDVVGSVEYYISESYKRIEVKVSPTFSLGIEFKVAMKSDPIEVPLLPIKIPFLFGAVSLDFTPKLVAKLSVSVAIKLATVKATIGFYFDKGTNGTTFKPIYSSSIDTFEVEVEGTFFIGLALEPALEILGGVAAYAEISGETGLYISAQYDPKSTATNADVIHSCDVCWDGDVSLGVKVGAELSVFKIPMLTNSISFFEFKWKFGDFYISYDHSEFGFGNCPYQDYRITVFVTDANQNPVSNAEVTTYDSQVQMTNDNGIAVFYLHPWAYFNHTLSAKHGDLERKVNFAPDKAQKLHVILSKDGESVNFFEGIIPGDVVDCGNILASGNCGNQIDNVTWKLYVSGLLKISGRGSMGEWAFAPWEDFSDQILTVEISDGVTNIAYAAFSGCRKIKTIALPKSITSIGEYAFHHCVSLESISIPENVTCIGRGAFKNCRKLKSITLPNAITEIDHQTFEDCCSLTSISIPKGAIAIGGSAFEGCYSLKNISIPKTVSSIGDFAFYGCCDLENVSIPAAITRIENGTFNGCESLTSISLPDNLTFIGSDAFGYCNFTSITIPDKVTFIGHSAFEFCSNLTRISLPDGITLIDEATFFECYNLRSIYIPSSVKSISSSVFDGCNKLTDIYFSGTQNQWNAIEISEAGNSCINKATIHFNSSGINNTEDISEQRTADVSDEAITHIENEPPTVNAIYPGDYGTEFTDDYIVKTASFKDLVPTQQYVLLALKSIEVANPLAPDNLLYIAQAAALDDGTLSFRYVQRETADASYVVACGASNKDLKDAAITFPEMIADGELQAVDPTVVYDGNTLAEGRDYVIVGTTSFNDAGTYACSIRGIRNYTGLVECTYTVGGADRKPNAPALTVSNVASSGKIKLSWEAVEGAVKYEVYRATSKSGTYDLKKTTTNTSFTNTSTTAGKTYYYYVVAVAENGTKSDPSAIKSRTCDLAQTTVTLSNVASSGKIKISWEAVEGATKYEVYRATSKSGTYSRISTTANTSVTNTKAEAGKTYYYKVRAICDVDAAAGAYSSIKSRTCDLAQTTVTLSNVASTGKIKISWEAVEGATKYEVYRATSKDGTYSRISTTSNTSVTNTKADAGKTYYYKVRAICDVDAAAAAYSSIKSRTCDLPQPSVSIALSSKKPKVSWDKVEGAVSYKVYRATSKTGTYSLVKTTTGSYYKDTNATAGKTYYYKVMAVCSNTAGNSAYSSIVSIKSK